MSANWRTKDGFTSKRGAFIAGNWYCDCEPRLPAGKFQTKNGGKNHGRWFYTCQKGKPKNCKFFLWTDDAKVREEGAVLSNSRSEPPARLQPPQTPTKMQKTAARQQPTPDTRGKIPSQTSQKNIDFEPEDSFDWPSSNDEELAERAQTVEQRPPQPLFETPRKTARNTQFSSPGKRTRDDAMLDQDDVFAAPKYRSAIPLSPDSTPALVASFQLGQAQVPPPEPSNLASEALAILHKNPAKLLPSVEKELIDLLNHHDLRTQGIAKGRDITRVAVQTKDERIKELELRIVGLEGEKETQRQVISQIKLDIATSPKKGS